ncbi:MAG: TIR domain-containing protein [Desulfobacteraceae bacterium]|nr:TIR domain-containing protein [Desulfobacteraceae bacterium]
MPENNNYGTPLTFLSYSSKDVHLADKIDSLFKSRKIPLLRYIREVHYWDNFVKYMNRIRECDFVITLISDSFFRSEYCMYEVTQLIRDGNYQGRFLPVMVNGTKINEPEEQGEVIKYWEDRYTSLTKGIEGASPDSTIPVAKRQKLYNRFKSEVGDFMEYVFQTKYPTISGEGDDNLEALLDKIGSSIKKAEDREKITVKVREQVRKLLDGKTMKPLRDALIRQLTEEDFINYENNPVLEHALVDINVSDAVVVLDMAIVDCFQVLETNGSKKEEIQPIWNRSVEILGWLMLLSVDYDCDHLSARAQGTSSGVNLEFPVVTEAGIEIFFSGYMGVPAKLSVNGRKNKIYGKNRVCCPRIETGWEEEDFVQSIKLDLWKKISKVQDDDAPGFIDKNKTKTLNTRIKIQNKKKKNIYITVSGDDLANPLRRKEMYEVLKRELPALHTLIITVGSDGDKDTVFIVSEPELEGCLLEFFQNKLE